MAPMLDDPEADGDDDGTSEGETETGVDAVELLQIDHDEVKLLFEEYESLADEDGTDDERQELAQQICQALTVHATIEEELLYPAARTALDDDSLVDEAVVEHASAKALIAEIEAMEPSEPLYDAKVKVLGEYVRHHIDEEEDELFPLLTEAGVDLEDLGDQLAQRKQELLVELGADEVA